MDTNSKEGIENDIVVIRPNGGENLVVGIEDEIIWAIYGIVSLFDVLYAISENLEAERVLETGVAYGLSSAAILKSISKRSGNLVSVDMPMIKQVDYHLIGTAVENKYLQYWELLRQPDKFGLTKAIQKLNYILDLAHYDSDKSYYGRRWSQPIIWKYIRKGGIFISDDIEDNAAFREFVTENQLEFSVLEFE